MDDKAQNRFVDELLEASLARYARVEPRPGLAERVLENLRAQPLPAPWLRWSRLLAATAVAVLTLTATVYFVQRWPRSVPAPATIAVSAPPAVVPAPSTPVETPRPAAAATARVAAPALDRVARATPRRERFPSPTPLSAQELLLLRFVEAAPAEALLASQETREPLGGLRVEPLNIPKLAVEELPRHPQEDQ